MSEKQKGKTYEAIPTRMVFPSIPTPSAYALINELATANGDADSLKISVAGSKTFDGNVEDACARTRALLSDCREQMDRGEPWAILDLLDVYPALVADIWVRETLLTLVREGRLKRRRGRPFSSYKVHPLIVVGIVDALISSGEAASPEKAFYHLAACKFLSYDKAKRRYYGARRDKRFKPIIMRLPGQVRSISTNEMDRELADVEVLRPGQKISRTVEDPDFGSVTITFTATE